MTAQARTGSFDTDEAAWRREAGVDGPLAFRAVVRATIEGAEGNEESTANQCGAVVFALLTSGDAQQLTSVLVQLVAEAHHADLDSGAVDGRQFIRVYGTAFVAAFLQAADDFQQSPGSVGDFLASGSRAEERIWRNALDAVGRLLLLAGQDAPHRHPSFAGRPRYVIYHYCVSLGIVTFRRTSEVKVIPPGGSVFLAGLPYTLISLVAGWWGIPWGPIYTLETIARNLAGGTDVTAAVTGAAV